ncbi:MULTISPECIES: truncated hemoglobin [Vibrio]|uniref:truncated hemoglobin n=1 Tax=Vibrio TaxID=662 RepID=UPI00142EF6FB|nr:MULTISPECIES: group 1 truncated hemoglobin [Vibrio]
MDNSLYSKYGGFACVHQIVERFHDKVLESKILAPYFSGINFDALVDHQVNFVTTIMGGPNCYDDNLLLAAHQHLSIDQDAWNEVVRILSEVLNEFNVESTDIEYLMNVIASKKQLIFD